MGGVQESGFCGNCNERVTSILPKRRGQCGSRWRQRSQPQPPAPSSQWRTWDRSVPSFLTRTATAAFLSQTQAILPNQFTNLLLALLQLYTMLSVEVLQLPQDSPNFCGRGRGRSGAGGMEGWREDHQPQFKSHFQPLAGSIPWLPHHGNLDITLEESQARNPKAAHKYWGRREGGDRGQSLTALCSASLCRRCPEWVWEMKLRGEVEEAAVVISLKVISCDSG